MNPFVTPIQELQYYDKYSRWSHELGRRETWDETCYRVMRFFGSQLDRRGLKLDKEHWDSLAHAMLKLEALPSMRIVQMAGPALERCNVGSYNCAYLPIDGWDAFGELLYVLMQGTGCGFSVEVDYVDELPRIKRQKGGKPKKYIVPDTTEGWCNALTLGLHAWADGEDVAYDFSRIRPQGAVLKTKGGRASGPEPLRNLLLFAREKLLQQQGRHINPIEAHDIACYCGHIVQVGGVRRAATISLSDLDDRDMRDAKNGQFWLNNVQRAMANNSAVYDGKPRSPIFMEEWLALAKSGTGERGIFNREGVRSQLPKRRQKHKELGINPCFAAGTLIQTYTGHFRVEDLVGQSVSIWNGEAWQTVDNFRVTAENQETARVTLQDGSEVITTPYHAFILSNGERIYARNLEAGMRLQITQAPLTHGSIKSLAPYLKGFLLGDGTQCGQNPALWLYEPKYICASRLEASLSEIEPEDIKATNIRRDISFRDDDLNSRKIMTGLSARRSGLVDWVTTYRSGLPAECFRWDLPTKAQFLAGIFDADGTASDTLNGWMYQLWATSKQLLLDIQALLKSIGVPSKLSLGKAAGLQNFNDDHGKYEAQDAWRLTISQKGSIALASQVTFSRLQSFAHKQLTYSLKPRFNEVVSIESAGVADKVFCCTVEGNHQLSLTAGIDIGQCGEIILRPRQFCNLSIAVARPNDTEETLKQKVHAAALFGTMQSLLTDFKYLPKEWKENCEEERLLGVDITGQMDCPLLRPSNPNRQQLLQALRQTAIQANQTYAQRFNIPQSAAVTCIKPSGNSAQLLNCSSGLHPRYAKYYVRRLRIGAYTPIAKLLKNAGVPSFPEVGQSEETATVLVFEFPVAAPDGAPTRHDLTAIQQLENWLDLKLYYTEHNPSVTIYVSDDEWPAVGAWVYEHFNLIGGLAFLPRDGGSYELAPYEEISEEEYHRRAKALPPIAFSKLSDYEKEDMTEVQRDYACTGERCEY